MSGNNHDGTTVADGDGGASEAPFQVVSSGSKRGGSGGHKKRGFAAPTPGGGAGGRTGVAAKINNQAQPKQIARIRNSLSVSDMSTSAGGAGHPSGGGGGGGTASSSPGTTGLGGASNYSPDSMSPRSASGGSTSYLSSSKWGGGSGAGHHSSPPTSGRLGRRADFSSLQASIDPYRYNIYHVKLEEELQSGDDYKDTLFQILRTRSINTLSCLICAKRLLVYDRYPLIDGCVFITPVRHQQDDRSIPFNSHTNNNNNSAKHQFVSCVCVKCLQGASVLCICCHCGGEWVGVAFQVGTIYPFDIFAANICCSERSKCSNCEKQLLSSSRPLPQRYAEFSQSFTCPSCQKQDSHFVKPMHKLFKIQNTNTNY